MNEDERNNKPADIVEQYLGTFLRWAADHSPNDAVSTNARQAAELMIVAERERCAEIARNGANLFRNQPIKFVTPEKYAADLADDIADAIENGARP